MLLLNSILRACILVAGNARSLYVYHMISMGRTLADVQVPLGVAWPTAREHFEAGCGGFEALWLDGASGDPLECFSAEPGNPVVPMIRQRMIRCTCESVE